MTRLLFVIFSLLHIQIVFSQEFKLTGDAGYLSGECYQLTPNKGFSSGAVWNKTKINLTEPFEIEFYINLGNDSNGGDGIGFVLQNYGDYLLGWDGGGFGYGNISPAVNIEFDTYYNSAFYDSIYDHVGFNLNGGIVHGQYETAPINKNLSTSKDGKNRHVKIAWNPETYLMEVFINCEKKISLTKDIIKDVFYGEKNVWWGFTSSTGSARNLHQVCSLRTLVNTTPAICEGTSLKLNAPISSDGIYEWTPSTYLNSSTLQTPTATPLKTTEYTVTYKSYCGGTTFSKKIVVPVNPTPKFEIVGREFLCDGETTLTAKADQTYNYLWENDQTSETRKIDTPGTYTLEAKTPFCSKKISKTIQLGGTDFSVEIFPEKNFICEGDSIKLGIKTNPSTIPINKYEWSNGETKSEIFIKKGGSYAITATSDSKCTNTAEVSLLEFKKPASQLKSNYFFCSEQETILKPVYLPNTDYLWQDGSINREYKVSQAGTYTLQLKDKNCTNTEVFTIDKEPEYKIGIEGKTVICPSSEINLTAKIEPSDVKIDRFLWSNGQTNIETKVSLAGIHLLEVEAHGCKKKVNKKIELPAPHSIVITPNQRALCSGGELKLNASISPLNFPIKRYFWNTGDSTNSITISKEGDYTFTTIDENECRKDTLYKVPKQGQFSTHLQNALLCLGESLILKPSLYPNANYEWQDGSVSKEYTVTKPGKYSLTIKDDVCRVTDTITVNYAPDFDIKLESKTILCKGKSLEILPKITPDTTQIQGYKWSNGYQKPVLSVMQAGDYFLTVKGKYCTKTATRKIEYSPNYSVIITPERAKLCENSTMKLHFSSDTPLFKHEWWNKSIEKEVTISEPGNYGITVENENGCVKDTAIFIAGQPKFNPALEPRYYFCEDDTVTIRPKNYIGAAYVWQDKSTNKDFKATNEGIYTVTVKDEVCTNTESTQVIRKLKDKFVMSFPKNKCIGSEFTLKAPKPTFPTTVFNWSNGSTGTELIVKKPGKYWVESEYKGCKYRVPILTTFMDCPLRYLRFPTIFTPNKDRSNENFIISNKGMLSYEWTIYDRWGTTVYSKNSGEISWDGNYRGEPSPEGTYSWTLTYTFIDEDLNEKKATVSGAVMLIR